MKSGNQGENSGVIDACQTVWRSRGSEPTKRIQSSVAGKVGCTFLIYIEAVASLGIPRIESEPVSLSRDGGEAGPAFAKGGG